MNIVKVLNNNVVLSMDENHEDVIVLGKWYRIFRKKYGKIKLMIPKNRTYFYTADS